MPERGKTEHMAHVSATTSLAALLDETEKITCY